MNRAEHMVLRSGIRAADLVERCANFLRPAGTLVPPMKADRIIVWTMDRIGDVQRATPLLRLLARRFPQARVTAVCAGRSAPILRGNPHIDELLIVPSPYDLSAHRRHLRQLKGLTWDLGVLAEVDPFWAKLGQWMFASLDVKQWAAFDFGLNRPSRQHTVPLQPDRSWTDHFRGLAAALGAEDDADGMELHLSCIERRAAEELLEEHGVDPRKPFLLVHPGGNFLTVSRQWPAASYGRLIDLVSSRWGLPIVVTGITAESAIIDQIRNACSRGFVDLLGKVDLRGLAAVIEHAALCVMNDTGPLHMAHALGRPTVVILGPTAPVVVGIPPTGRVVHAELPCRPCAFLQGWQACTNPETWACLLRITPDAVMEAIADQVAVHSIAVTCPVGKGL
jgi:ADP-heptose:LPS heptosyltransferase